MKGSKRPLGPRKWELRVSTGHDPVSGKYRQKSRTFEGSAREADAALRKFAAEVDEGQHVGTDATVAKLLEEWVRQYRRDWSVHTVLSYETNIRLHILPAVGNVPLNRLKPTQLNDLYATMLDKGLTTSTARKVHNILRRALAVGVEWGWVNANVAMRAKKPKPQVRPITPPSDEQVAAILAGITNTRRANRDLLVFLTLAEATGARRGEVCGLKFSDFDPERRELFIGRSVAQVGQEITIKGTKTDRQRRIALDEATAGVLVDYMAETRARMVDPVADPWLFSDSLNGGVVWKPTRVTRAWNNLRRKAGEQGVRLHDLRHAHATLLLALGVDVRTVAGRLGHANPSTTLLVYGHFVPAADRRAADVWASRDKKLPPSGPTAVSPAL